MYNKDWTQIIHKEGYIFIVIFAAATFILGSISSFLGIIGFILTTGCIYFFRNPNRIVPSDDSAIIAPADGIIQSIKQVVPPKDIGLEIKDMTRISIFLSIFDVHVNRIPIKGTIKSLNYQPGKFINASLDKASIHNERQSIIIETPEKINIGLIQIAGLVARRIVCNLEENDKVIAGERFGIIRFGSRVDIYIPAELTPLISIGQTVIGGETILARITKEKIAAPKFNVI